MLGVGDHSGEGRGSGTEPRGSAVSAQLLAEKAIGDRRTETGEAGASGAVASAATVACGARDPPRFARAADCARDGKTANAAGSPLEHGGALTKTPSGSGSRSW